MKILSLLFALLLTACQPTVAPAPEEAPEGNDNTVEPTLGVKVKVAYVQLKSFTQAQAQDPMVQAQMEQLWLNYDSVYMIIQPGQGLRYYDFGSILVDPKIPVKRWTTEDNYKTSQWHYMISIATKLEDNGARDYSWEKYGFAGQFTRHPFAMHYRHPMSQEVKFNVVGVYIDPVKYEQEVDSSVRLLSEIKEHTYQTTKTIMFGNFTQDCANSAQGLIIQKNTEECFAQSVVMSKEAEDVSKVKVIMPSENTDYNTLTTNPIIEVELSL